jgi:ankyrin repeat protein
MIAHAVRDNETVDVLGADDPLAIEATRAVQAGDLQRLQSLLREHPSLATARIGAYPDGMSRTLLHAATDWPGHFPNNAASVRLLIEAGADVDARFTGPHTETPLHWAASSDDVEVLDVLLDAGADIEATGAVIAGGTPLADATAFGQWNAARRLIERGARSNLFESACLGLLDRIEPLFCSDARPGPDDVTGAFWGACHGGQRQTAAFLLARGADLNWVSRWDSTTPLDAARRSGADGVAEWLLGIGAVSAES